MRPTLALLAALTGLLAPAVGRAADAAPTPEAISLPEAIARAAAGNVDLRRQNVALRTAAAGTLAALGKFDLLLGADATFARSVNPPLRAGDQSAGSTKSLVFDVSLSRALESGGSLSLAAQGRGVTSTSTFTCGLPPGTTGQCKVYTPNVTLQFTQPLLRGFGREYAEASLRKQRLNQDLALLNRQAHAANDVRDTVIAYWELAYQMRDLEIRRSAEALAREQLAISEAQIKVGRMGQLEAASVRRAIAQAQQDEAASEQQLMGRALDLQRLFGAAVPRGFVGLAAAEVPSSAAHEVNVDAETAHALEASPALKALRKGLALTEIDVQVAQSSLRPQLDFGASVGRQGRNLDVGTSLDQLGNNNDTNWSAGLTFSLPVQNRAARGAAEIARAAGDSAQLDATDLELAIRDGVARLGAQVRSAGARVGFAREAVTFAQQNLEAERAKFDVGRSTNNDVLLRQQELKQAQIAVARADVDLLEADAALAALTGDLLDAYGVTLRP
jgi:outer membrane protein